MQRSAPDELRSLVLDYLTHSGYIQSAQAFLSDSTVRHIDVDGDEVMDTSSSTKAGGGMGEYSEISDTTVRRARLRNEIRHEIRCGRINEAVNTINEHFPVVLSMQASTEMDELKMNSASPMMEYAPSKSVHPAHLLLNIRIQAFVEACRTVPLEYPPKPTPGKDKSTPSMDGTRKTQADSPETIDQQTALLKSAQKLYALANMLPSKEENERYMQELKNVVGLIAYRVPEESPVSSYLSQERREALAEQVDSAILCHLDLPVISRLELHMRRNCAIWKSLNELGIQLKAGAPSVPHGFLPSPGKGEEPAICPTLDIQAFLDL